VVKFIKTLSNSNTEVCKKTYLTYRAEVHRLNLQEKPANEPEDKFKRLAGQVKKIWDGYL